MDWRASAYADAVSSYPAEACGLVVIVKGRTRYWPCNNLATGDGHFIIDPHSYATAEDAGEVIGVFHSHPDEPPLPSEADRLAAEGTSVEWHILSLPSGAWGSFKPSTYVAPLVGREFVHGQVDCYTMVRDWYRVVRGITLPDFHREDEWWVKGENLYLDNFALAGFGSIPSEQLSHGDVLLMKVQSPVPNHAAVYIGDGMILHHLYGRLSSRDVYNGLYQSLTVKTLRYAS